METLKLNQTKVGLKKIFSCIQTPYSSLHSLICAFCLQILPNTCFVLFLACRFLSTLSSPEPFWDIQILSPSGSSSKMTAIALAVEWPPARQEAGGFPISPFSLCLKGGGVHVLLLPAALGSDWCKTKPMVCQKLSTGAGTTFPVVAEGNYSSWLEGRNWGTP